MELGLRSPAPTAVPDSSRPRGAVRVDEGAMSATEGPVGAAITC